MGDVLRLESRLLRGPQLCRLAGVSYRQLDYWARNGVLDAAIAARGSGSQRRYTWAQARAAFVLKQLSELGARRDALASAAEELQSLSADEWAGWLLVWPDGVTQLTDDPRDVVTPVAYLVDLTVCAATFERWPIHQSAAAAL